MKVTVALFTVAAVLSIDIAFAEEPASQNKLVPGGADTIHDVLGIAIGMPCEDARLKEQQLAGGQFNPNGDAYREAFRLDGVRDEFTHRNYKFPVRYKNSSDFDIVTFSCVGEEPKRQVYQILREIAFGEGVEKAPSIASLRGLFQEKYGVPTVVFSPTTFATMFNKNGQIKSKGPSCVLLENNYLNDPMFGIFNDDKCTYELTFVATESRDRPGSITRIKILIADYIREENIIRDLQKASFDQTPVVAPKL